MVEEETWILYDIDDKPLEEIFQDCEYPRESLVEEETCISFD